MKTRILFITLGFMIFFYACKKDIQPRNIKSVSIEEIKIDSSSIRAIHALKDSTLFYATSNGLIGMIAGFDDNRLENKIIHDTIIPHFRAITSNGNSIFCFKCWKSCTII